MKFLEFIFKECPKARIFTRNSEYVLEIPEIETIITTPVLDELESYAATVIAQFYIMQVKEQLKQKS